MDWNEVEETEDVRDESSAYLDFLSEEVSLSRKVLSTLP